MPVYRVEGPSWPDRPNTYLVFAIPRGGNTAIIFSEDPDSKGKRSIINAVEDVATAAFQSIPQLNGLDESKLEFYTTMRLAVDAGDSPMERVSRVTFSCVKRRAKGLTLSREWSFEGASWGEAEEDVTVLFDRAAWEAGYVAQVYGPKTGWSIPDRGLPETDEDDD